MVRSQQCEPVPRIGFLLISKYILFYNCKISLDGTVFVFALRNNFKALIATTIDGTQLIVTKSFS